VVKMLIATAATFALVTAASAADLLPHRQPAPAYSEAPPVGKMPIGKGPVGKAPFGKGPVAARY
jgi:hypothetical protein